MQSQNIFVTGMMTAFVAALIAFGAAPAMVSAQEPTITLEDMKSLAGFQNYSVLGSFKKALVQDEVLYQIMRSNKELSEETMRNARLQRKILQDIQSARGDTGLALNPYVLQFSAQAAAEESPNGNIEEEQQSANYPTSNSAQGSTGGSGGGSGGSGGGGGLSLGGGGFSGSGGGFSLSTASSASPCELDGAAVLHNQSRDFFSEATPACGTSCADVKLRRKCVDGTFDGETSFDTATCTLPTGCDAAECIDTGNPIEDELANAAAGNDCAPAKYTQVSAGDSHTCALKSDGSAWCWGDGRRGRLGYGGEDNQQIPVQVVELGSDVKSISAGGSHTCAVKTDGSAWCWGTNHSGQLGDDTTEHRLKPTRVSGLSAGVSTVSAGNIHTCAVKADGSAWCWGSGAEGRLGNGSRQTSEHTPVAVDVLGAGVADISAASSHTCALKTDNTVYCWGRHTFGELGIGEIVSGVSQKTKPVKVTGISGVQSITTNTFTTCAVKGDRSPWCWGAGWSVYLGEDSKDHKLEPTPVPALTAIKDISAGSKHNCALKESGCIWCWGDGELGELGHGEFVDSKDPVQVANPQGGGTGGAGEDEASCTLDGVTLADGDSEDFFKEQNPACGTSCDDVKLSRTCIAGSLIGNINYEFATCTEPTGCSSGASCTTIDGETRPDGWKGNLFSAPSVSCLNSCENRTAATSSSWIECKDGKFQRCWGGFGAGCRDFTISYGGNQTAEVCPGPVPPGGCPVSGTPPTVVENNAFASCTVNPCRSTTHDGDVRPHDWQGSLYAKSVVPCGTCPSPRPCSCSDGTFKGECSWSGQNPKDNFFTSCRSERASCQWQAVGSEQISSALLHLGAGPGLCSNDNQPPAGTCSRNNTTASSSANQCGVMVNEVIQDDGTRLFPFTCNDGGGCFKEMNIYECR